MSRQAVPVSTLVHYLKEMMESDAILHGVLVQGEISNLRIPYSGHWYFSLKDEKASISCVMFASSNRNVKFKPSNGMKVFLQGDVSVYETSGTVQLIAHSLTTNGIGDLYLQYEQLKKKLEAEGLFLETHKKQLPLFPMSIGLVTGNQTAGREDVLITLKNRWPIAKVTEYPCPVQGMDASPKIISALLKADQNQHDVILLCRGGGSLEDLWCFNNEQLARCIYELNTPIVTGIGHETDFTLADFVADVRANTPTGAVNIAVPDQNEIHTLLKQYKKRLETVVTHKIAQTHQQLQHLSNSKVFLHPEYLYLNQANTLNYLNERLSHTITQSKEKRYQFNQLQHRFNTYVKTVQSQLQNQIDENRLKLVVSCKQQVLQNKNQLETKQKELQHSLKNLIQDRENQLNFNIKLLDAYSPLKVMSRGYSVVYKEDQVVTSVKEIKENDEIAIRMKDGIIISNVKKKENDHGEI